jgi:hypothetical protein
MIISLLIHLLALPWGKNITQKLLIAVHDSTPIVRILDLHDIRYQLKVLSFIMRGKIYYLYLLRLKLN